MEELAAQRKRDIFQVEDMVLIKGPTRYRNYFRTFKEVTKFWGKKAQIIGFLEISVGRGNKLGIKPGIYADTLGVLIVLSTGREMATRADWLELLDKKEERKRRVMSAQKTSQETFRFVRELPRTAYKEGDLVKIAPISLKVVCLDNVVYPEDVFKVKKVDYHLLDERMPSERKWPIYNIQSQDMPQGVYLANEDELISAPV